MGHAGPVSVSLVVGEADRDLADLLDDRINAFNYATTGHHDGRLLSVRVTRQPSPADDGTSTVVAGLHGWTWGHCGFVDLLWVDESLRGQGLGTQVMDAAEAEMAARGCAQVVLSSHSFQAPAFYERRGYREVCRVEGYPAGHAQVTLVKPLRVGPEG